MRGFERVVAAGLLIGAVAGIAGFAHLLGSEPTGQSSLATLPPAPAAPLIVQADPWSPLADPVSPARPRLGAAIARPTGQAAAVTAVASQHAKTPSIHVKSIVRIAPVAPRPTIAAKPAPVTAPVAAAPPVAAPAPSAAPTVTTRGLTTLAPVPAAPAAAPAAGPTAPTKHGLNERPGRDRDKNPRHGGSGSDDSSRVVLSATPVPAPQPVTASQPVTAPQPVVAPPPPSIDPPAPSSTWSQVASDAPTGGGHGHRAGTHLAGAWLDDSH
jgi:hypothetical protein